ncbi:hypothetical protein AUC43_17870 [Hymenobacter sedentarius]|uniref:STAS/SEC14 domain-containing protein n=1 Tax=Hymenobacter sedentarius TaxID=1411621 RepID=A0A0U4CTM8_9BACT|nr:hypothetical protein [Hymenobacter sedentarius]ALW86782.1 hypothetical protein AUC43_17870 [Hymenobacter sedentarius]
MQLLASYPYLKLYLHEGAGRALEAQWTGVAASPVLRRATLECIELARAHGVTGWVADDRRLGPVSPVDLSWIYTYVFPLLVQGGVRRFARLEAEDPQTQRVVSRVQEIAAQKLTFELCSFNDPAEARAWACGGSLR